MKRSLGMMMLVGLTTAATAQVQHGGEPLNWDADHLQRQHAKVELPPLADEFQEDLRSAPVEAGRAFQFGTQRAVTVDVLTDGSWTMLPDGRKSCHLTVASPGAAMLSIQFAAFDLLPGDELFFYDMERSQFLGSFNENNELPTGRWATRVIPGDEAVIELTRAANTPNSAGALVIESVTHGVIDIFNFGHGAERDYFPGYPAAPCQVNIACPQGAGWEQVASSVAMFLRPDGHGCTGSLINNTRNDGTPYFYLANHCNLPPHDQWVFYFNYEAPQCVGDTGQTVETVVGADLRAAEHFSDHTLLELFTPPQQNYDVYYAGWDRGNNNPQSATVIAHPAYDVKKIIQDHDVVANGTGTTLDPNLPTWVTGWDLGITEFATSGASVFDHNKRVVGLVTESWGDCAALGGVSASRFSEQWDGTLPHLRLRDWLDPDDLGHIAINGHDPNVVAAPVTLRVLLQGPYDATAGTMTDQLRAASLIPLTEPYTSLGFAHQGEGGGETTMNTVLSTTGNDAIVDWVLVELRDANDPTSITYTRSALLQRDGDVVDTDGVTPITFNVTPADYYIAVQHRNHLGIMTDAAVSLPQGAGSLDLSTVGSTDLFGGDSTATEIVSGRRLMVHGDVTRDAIVQYTGIGNDRDPILTHIGGSVPTAVTSGYAVADTNMDGMIKYLGVNNDRDPILNTIGGSVPTATRAASLP